MLSSLNKLVAQNENCDGIPNPGNTISSVSSACPTQNFILSLENDVQSLGITYQWESADDIDFTENTEFLGTNSTQVASINSSKYFRCLVTCDFSSESTYSTPVLVSSTQVSEYYCIPPDPVSGWENDIVVDIFVGNDYIDFEQTCTPPYEDRSLEQEYIPSLSQGQTVEMLFYTGGEPTPVLEYYGVWIDFDQSGSFDENEFFSFVKEDIGYTPSGYITIDYNALTGYTKMRIKYSRGYPLSGDDACTQINYGYVRDYFVNITPTCFAPSNIQTSNIASNSATISWEEAILEPINGYQIYYNTTGVAPNVNTEAIINIPADDTSVLIDNLQPITKYYVWLRSNCGNDNYSVWLGPKNFWTTQIPATLPYEDDFATNQFTFINGTQTNKWAYGSATGNPENAIYISNDGGLNNTYTTSGDYLTSATSVVQAFRDIAIPNGTSLVNFSFDWKCVGEGTPWDYFRVWMVSATYMPTAGTQITNGEDRIQIGGNFSQQSTWQTYQNSNLDISRFAGQTMRLVFEWRNDNSGGSNPPVAIDNVSLFGTGCVAPTNMQVSLNTQTSAVFTWETSTSNPEIGYQIYYNTTGEAPDANTEATVSVNATTTSFTTGDILEVNTEYFVWIRSVCNNDDFSDWIGPTNFTTPLCVPAPWTEGFASLTLPEGWTNSGMILGNGASGLNNGGASGNYICKHLFGANNATSGNFSTLVVGNITEIDFLSFDYKIANFSYPYTPPTLGSGNFVLEVSTDFGFTWTQIETVNNNGIAGWQNKTYSLAPYVNEYVRFRITVKRFGGAYYIGFDNFKIGSCFPPSALSVQNITENSTTINWTAAVSNPDSYKVYYSTVNTAPTDDETNVEITNTNSITLTELEPITKYYVWVKTICEESDYNAWVGPVHFTTTQIPATLPYIDDFATNQYTFANGTYTNQWTYGSAEGNPENAIYISNDNGENNTYSNSFSLVHAFRDIAIPSNVNFASFSFDWKCASEGTTVPHDFFRVWIVPITYVPTAGIGISSEEGRIQIGGNFNNQAEWQTFQNPALDLSSFTEQTMRLVFEWRNDNAMLTNPPATIDNVSLIVPECFAPANIQVTISSLTSATITWDTSVSNPEIGYQIYYNTTGIAPDTYTEATISVNAEITSITTDEILEANTEYFVWMRSICDNDSFSDWAGPYRIITPLCVPAPWTEFFDLPTLPTGWTNNNSLGTAGQIDAGGASGNYIYKHSYNSNTAVGRFSTLVINNITGAEYLSFDYKIAQYTFPYEPPVAGTGNFVLEISTDFGNTWTQIETVNNNGIKGWQNKIYSLADYADEYVKFRITSNRTNWDYYIAFDNFYLTSCMFPRNLSVNNITTNSANITWTASISDPGSYQVYLSTTNIAPADNETNVETTNTNSIILSDLEPNSKYYVWVRSDCGAGNLSNWTGSIEFETFCLPMVTLPYTESFDSYGTGTSSFPDCWTKPSSYGSYPYIASTNSVSSPASLQIRSNPSDPTYIVSPAFTEDIHNLRVSFQLKAESTTYLGRIDVGVMSDYWDINTFEVVATIQPTNTNFNYYEYDLYATNLSGPNNHIAVRHKSSTNVLSYWLDDFLVELSPNCIEPLGFEVNSHNSNSVNLSWEPLLVTPENGYDIYVSLDNTAPTSLTSPTNNTAEGFISIDGLSPETTYYAWLRVNCNNDETSEWVGPVTFTTLCAPLTMLPYSENFDSYDVDTFPNCWIRPVKYDNCPSIDNAHSASPTNSLKLKSLSTQPTYAILPAFAEDIHNLRVSFNLKALNTTNSGIIELGVMSNPWDINTFEVIATIQPANTNFNYYQYDLYSTNLSGANNYIALRHKPNVHNFSYFLDDIVVEHSPNCIEPFGFEANNITSNSINLSWFPLLDTPENGYDIYLASENTPPTALTSTNYNTTEGSIYIDGLIPETTYYAWLRVNCNNDETSEWVGPVTFTTLCEQIATFPYTENFDSYGTGANVFPNCWSKPITYNSYPYIASGLSVSSPASLRFQSLTTEPTYAVSPAFAEDIHNLRVSFKLKAESISNSGTIDVGVMSDPEDITTFELVATIQPTNTSFINYQYDLYATNLSGANNHIALRHNSNSSGYFYWLDDFVVEFSPSCMQPANLTIDNITTNSANISWAELPIAPENGYDVYISQSNTAPTVSSIPTHNTIEEFISIGNLDSGTTHYVWVRANCGNSETSAWFVPVIFTTLCTPVVSLPYTENFDSYGTGANAFPNCWSKPVTYNNYPYIVSDQSVSSPNSLRFQSLSTEPTYAVSPVFSEDIQTLRVSFKLKASTIPGSGTIDVGVMSDPEDISTFETVATITPTNTSFNYYYYDLYSSTLSGANNHIAFKHNSNSNYNSYWLDDFKVELSPSCFEPETLEVTNITAFSASFSWTTSGSNPSSYQVYYSTINTTPTDDVTDVETTNTNSINLNGLLPNATTYYVWVRSNCGVNGYSVWTGPVSFTTECTTISTLPHIENFDTYDTGTLPNCWARPLAYTTYNGTYPSVASGPFVSSPKNLKFQSSSTEPTYAVSPAFAEDIHNLRVSFYLKADDLLGSGTMSFGVMSDPADISTFELVETIQPTNESWMYYQYDLYSTTLSGANNHIAFIHNSNEYLNVYWLDNLTVELITCYEPQVFEVSDITKNSANITWETPISNPDTYHVYCSTTNTAPNDNITNFETTANNSIVLNELENLSTYYVWVRSVCGGNDYSLWFGPTIFTTFPDCSDAITSFPYFEEFEEPTCWSFTNTHTNPNSNWHIGEGYSGNGLEALYSDANLMDEWAISPEFDLSGITNVTLSFDFYMSYYWQVQNDGADLMIKVTTDDGNTWTQIWQEEDFGTFASYTWNTASVLFNNYTGESIVKFAFHYLGNSGAQVKIDNVNLEIVSLSTETDIVTFSFTNEYSPAIIHNDNYQVITQLVEGTDLTNLVATFTLSEGATVKVGEIIQESGITANDFTNPVVYTVIAEDGVRNQDWTVNASIYTRIETAENSALTIYPNPNKGKFTLDFTNINGKVNYQIFDTKGSIILSDNFVANRNTTKEISLDLVPGVYFVKLVTKTQCLVEKLVVE